MASFDVVLFERSASLPLGFTWLVVSMLLVLILLVLALLKRTLAQPWLNVMPRAGLFVKAAAIVFAITLLFGASNVMEWQKFKQALATQTPTVLEGVINSASAKRITRPGNSQNPSYFDRETLQINERVITTESNNPSTPFPLLVENGGKLKVGSRVRFTFVGETVMKVETVRP
jgi:hypothetical protein